MIKLDLHIRDELKRICFFLRFASVLEEHFPKRVTNTLMRLPVDWDENFILINGKKISETKESDYFICSKTYKKLPKNVSIKGKVKGKLFTLKIVYGSFFYEYYLDFEDGSSFGEKIKIKSLESVKKILENIDTEKDIIEKDLSEAYYTLFKGKEKVSKFKEGVLSKFFPDYIKINWVAESFIDLHKGGVIKIKIYANNVEPEQHSVLFKMMTETDPERAKFKLTELLQYKIPNYVKSLLNDAGYLDLNVQIKGIMSPSVSEEGVLSGKLGFVITIL